MIGCNVNDGRVIREIKSLNANSGEDSDANSNEENDSESDFDDNQEKDGSN